jgi:hypothetical protein
MVLLILQQILPILDYHTLLLFFKLKMDTGAKKSQFQDSLLLPQLLQETLVLKVQRVKNQLLMLKNPKTSLMVELIRPILDYHMPQLFFKQNTGAKLFLSQGSLPLPKPQRETLTKKELKVKRLL